MFTLADLLRQPWNKRLAQEAPEVKPLETAQYIGVHESPFARAIVAPVTLTVPRRPSFWPAVTPPQLAGDPRHPYYARFDDGSVIHSSEASVDASLDAAARWTFHCSARLDDAVARGDAAHAVAFWGGELDIAKRVSSQKGRTAFAFLGRLGPEPGPDPSGLDDEWERTAYRLISAANAAADPANSAAYAGRPDPTDTNPGWPFIGGGLLGRLGGAVCAAPTAAAVSDETQLTDDWESAADALAMPPATAGCYTLAYRAGPSNKDTTDWRPTPTPGRFRADQVVARAAPRARHVFMASGCSNRSLNEPWATTLLGMKAAFPGYDQTRPFRTDLATTGDTWASCVASAAANAAWVRENDISGYDQNVHPGVQDRLRDAWCRAMPLLAPRIRLWRWSETRPVISPPWSAASWSPSVAHKVPVPGYTLVGSFGGTHSGSKLTAVVGSLICLTTTLTILSRLLKIDAVSAYLSGALTVLDLGDDILIMLTRAQMRALPDSWEADWIDAWKRVGFKVTMFNGTRFLMQHTFPAGRFPILSRIVQQTLFPEYPPMEGALAAIGFLARTEAAYVPHGSYQPLADALLTAEWLSKTPGARAATSLAALREAVERHWAPAIATWLAANEGSVARWAEESEWSSTAARIVAYLRSKFNADAVLLRIETAKRRFWEAYERAAAVAYHLPTPDRRDLQRRWLAAVGGVLTYSRAKLHSRPGNAQFRAFASAMPQPLAAQLLGNYYPELVLRTSYGE